MEVVEISSSPMFLLDIRLRPKTGNPIHCSTSGWIYHTHGETEIVSVTNPRSSMVTVDRGRKISSRLVYSRNVYFGGD